MVFDEDVLTAPQRMGLNPQAVELPRNGLSASLAALVIGSQLQAGSPRP